VTDPEGADEPFDATALPVDDPDELAGVVDLFGALARPELTRAVVELAYRDRGAVDESAVAAAVDAAVAWSVDHYYLVEYTPDSDVGSGHGDASPRDDGDGGDAGDSSDSGDAGDSSDGDDEGAGETLLTVGPVSFPSLPAEAEDLPHILDYPTRAVSRESLARSVEGRLRGDAARAVAAGDDARARHLLDVTYDLEAWAPVDVGGIRDRLDDALAAADAAPDTDSDSEPTAGSDTDGDTGSGPT
jgi:hypothetical protein